MSDHRQRLRGRIARCAASLLVATAGLTAVGGGRASAADPNQPAGCPVAVTVNGKTLYFPNEQYPPAGLPRNASPVPYEIPFAGQMTNGQLTVGTANSTVLGPANANLCGLFSLPSQVGTSTTNQLLITNNPVPVNLVTQGIEVFVAYIQLTATITASIDPAPASNGGINLRLDASFAGTLVPQPGVAGLLTIPASVTGLDCTTTVGPITFTTGKSGKLTGKPVTGKLNGAQTSLVANDFVYPPLNPATPPVTTTPAPPAGASCDPTVAATINGLLGLPAPKGNATFTADATFAIHATA